MKEQLNFNKEAPEKSLAEPGHPPGGREAEGAKYLCMSKVRL